jgi:streptogramin lyase
MKSCHVFLGCLLGSLCLLSGNARAQIVDEFSTGIPPGSYINRITAGPDGNLWFTGNSNWIGRITPQGVITMFNGADTNDASYITAGPDGNLWFAERGGNRIGRITPQGGITRFYAGAQITGITAGPDGNVWFAEGLGRIGRITPAGVVTEFGAGISGSPAGIALGLDGNLWFTESDRNRIGRITPQGVVTEFSLGISAGAEPRAITAGPDGNLWFIESKLNRIGRITLAGVVTEFSVGPVPFRGQLKDITAGRDGNLWFTHDGGSYVTFDDARGLVGSRGSTIGRLAPGNGVVTEFSGGLRDSMELGGITAGLDGNLWFTDWVAIATDLQGRIGRIDVGAPPTARLNLTLSLLPANDRGRFNLQIDGVTHATANHVGNGGSTQPQVLSPGPHTVAETAVVGFNLADYVVTVGGDCDALGQITLAPGDSKTCTITNRNVALCKAGCDGKYVSCLDTANSQKDRARCVVSRNNCNKTCAP